MKCRCSACAKARGSSFRMARSPSEDQMAPGFSGAARLRSKPHRATTSQSWWAGRMQREATLLLRRGDVEQMLTLRECIDAVEEIFRMYGEGKVPAPGILAVK